MKKVVVKIGSSVIAPQGKLDSRLISRMVKDILSVEEKGCRVVLVSSGAIACGLQKLGYSRKPSDMHTLMALSSLGQICLMDVYSDKFKKYKKDTAQILLTWDDFDNRKRYINAKHTIDKLLAMGVIPIINENDAVACDEIRYGDNDRLAASVADLIGAEFFIILSDVKGLMDSGKLVKAVDKINDSIMRLAGKKEKRFTAGGMQAKLESVRIAVDSGIKTVIACGRDSKVISRIIEGKQVGTLFAASGVVKKARKRWIESGKKIKGRLCIDDGARDALLNKGKSLLNVGISSVEGGFKKGDSVQVVDSKGVIIGCGLVNYSCEELRASVGKKLNREVIHRDDFVKSS